MQQGGEKIAAMHVLAGLWYTGCLLYRLLVQQGGEKNAQCMSWQVCSTEDVFCTGSLCNKVERRMHNACPGRSVVHRMSFVQAPCATKWREECAMHVLAGLWYKGCLLYRLLVQQSGEKNAQCMYWQVCGTQDVFCTGSLCNKVERRLQLCLPYVAKSLSKFVINSENADLQTHACQVMSCEIDYLQQELELRLQARALS